MGHRWPLGTAWEGEGRGSPGSVTYKQRALMKAALPSNLCTLDCKIFPSTLPCYRAKVRSNTKTVCERASQTVKIYCSQKGGCLTRREYLPRTLDFAVFSFTVPGDTLLSHFQLRTQSALLDGRGLCLSFFTSSSAQQLNWMNVCAVFYSLCIFLCRPYHFFLTEKPRVDHSPFS